MRFSKFITGFAGILLTCLCSLPMASAQNPKVQLSLSVAPPYPIHLEDWMALKGQVILTATNLGSTPLQVKLLVEIQGNNGVSVKTKPIYQPAQPLSLAALETKVLSGVQLRNLNANLQDHHLDIQGVRLAQIIQSEQLPEGVYSICVRAYDYVTGALLSSEMMGCANVNVTWYDPPILTFPIDKDRVAIQTPQFQLFSWTPSGIGGKTRYRFELVDMTFNQLADPNDAFQTPAVQPYYKQENLLTLSLPYDISKPPLQKKHRYAWRVTAYDPTQSTSFKNGGKSEVHSFTYGKLSDGPQDIVNPTDPKINPDLDLNDNLVNNNTPNANYAPPCTPVECNPGAVAGPAVNTGFQPGDIVTLGHFNLELSNFTWQGNKMAGSGRVDVPMFKCKIPVDFSDLQVNAGGQIISGTARANYDPLAFVAEALKSPASNLENVTPSMIQTVHKYVDSLEKYTSNFVQEQSQKLPFAMMTEKAGQLQLINITAIEFKPSGARFNAFLSMEVPENNTTIGFGAKGICFHPTGLTGQTIEKLHLLGDGFTLPFGPKVDLNIITEGPKGGTYIKWDCEGYQEIQVEGDFAFQTSMLVPVKNGETKVHARFLINSIAWSQLVGQVDFDPFKIAGIQNLGFTFDDVTFDFSDGANPPGMAFPAEWQGAKDNTWRGFYFKNITVLMPEYLKKNGQAMEVGMENCIIGKEGFTGGVFLQPFFGLGDGGNVGGWAFSVEKFKLSFVNNSINGSSFDGKIRVPISKTGIGYHCAISTSGGKLNTEFGIENTEDIDVEMWIAKVHLENGSSILVKVVGNSVECTANLTGKITILGEFKDLEAIKVEIPDMAFTNLRVSNKAPVISCSNFALSSPQKFMNGFEMSFDPADAPEGMGDMLGVDLSSSGDTCTLKIGFMLVIGEGGNGIAGLTSLSVKSRLINQNGGYTWTHEKTRLDSIGINAHMAAVTMIGKLVFYHGDDPTFGKGLRGNFQVTVKPAVVIDANLQFGKLSNGKRYWYVDALAKFTPGLPVGPAFAFYGFGGGAYYNMTVKKLPVFDAFKGVEDPDKPDYDSDKPGQTFSGVEYVPKTDGTFGLMATVVMGTYPSSRPFNMDVKLSAQINGNGGLDFIRLDLDGYFMCDVTDRKNPKVFADGYIQYQETGGKKIFDAGLSATINFKPILSGGGTFAIHCESAGLSGEEGKWYVLLGTPEQRCSLEIFTKLKVGTYIMAGNQIPGPPGLPPEMAAEIDNYQPPKFVGNEVAGFGFGMNFTFSTGDMKFLILYANLTMILGFDVFLIDASGIQCPDIPNPGINKFYALGQVYAGFDARAGIDVDVWFIKARFEIFRAYIYAALQAGMPNPTWMRGTITGGYSLFNGLIDGSFTIRFKAGQVCDPASGHPFGGLEVMSDVLPKGDAVNPFAVPEVAMNLNMHETHKVVIPTETDSVTRYFKFYFDDMKVTRIKSMKNGKMSPVTHEDAPGTFKLVNPKLVQFDKTVILKPYSEYEITAKVYGKTLEDGKWVTIKDSLGKNTYYEVRKHIFRTGELPFEFDQMNMAYSYPYANERYLHAADIHSGVIQFNDDFSHIYKIKPKNKGYMYAYYVKFYEVGGGMKKIHESTFTAELPQQRIKFDMPKQKLKNSKIYLVQFVARLVKDPSQWLSNGQEDRLKTVNTIQTDTDEQDNTYKQTKKEQRLTGIPLESGEFEFHHFFFRTSRYATLKEKWEACKVKDVRQGAGDYQWRLIREERSEEAWGMGSIRPYAYKDGSNTLYTAPLLNPRLAELTRSNSTSVTGRVNNNFYVFMNKYLYGGNNPCTEDQLVHDWERIFSEGKLRTAINKNAYSPNSWGVTENTFSDAPSTTQAVGLVYQGDGPLKMSIAEARNAYWTGYKKETDETPGDIIDLKAGPGGGSGQGMVNNDLPLQALFEHTLLTYWDYAQVGYYGRKDFKNLLFNFGNQGPCENGFFENFLQNGWEGNMLPYEGSKTSEIFYDYQVPPGVKTSNIKIYGGTFTNE